LTFADALLRIHQKQSSETTPSKFLTQLCTSVYQTSLKGRGHYSMGTFHSSHCLGVLSEIIYDHKDVTASVSPHVTKGHA